MRTNHFFLTCFSRWAGLILLLLTTPVLHAQPFAITSPTTGNGGSTSTNTQYTVSGTIGQPVGSSSTNSQFGLAGGFWNTVMILQTPDAPVISVSKSGSNLVLTWTDSGNTFTLQETTSLDAPVNWITSTTKPVADKSTVTATIPITGNLRFYRLYYQAK